MSRLTGWWSGRSSAAKVELYTRWTFHLFILLEVTGVGFVPLTSHAHGDLGTGPALAVALLVVVLAALCGLLSSRAIDWQLDRRERPVRLMAVVAGLTAVGALTLITLQSTRTLTDPGVAGAVVVGSSAFTLGSVALCIRSTRQMAGTVLVASLGSGLAALVLGLDWPQVLAYPLGVALSGGSLVAACGFSGWLLRTVWELERSRDLKARLAVAEERLRFGRDLHDVMGRNLSVIALKSELAVQLARRGRPEAAVDQMTEVQRIAQESQREVRDVVRGYREADLRVELEGARGVLAAAGITCAMDPAGIELPGEVQSALGWVVREATTNVLRHGDARQCLISLREEDGAVLLVVENDGVGDPADPADQSPARRPGSGLAGLRERLAAVGGTLEAAPETGGRFRVTARVSLTGGLLDAEGSVPEPVPPGIADAVGAVPSARKENVS
ncbi:MULTISPECIES: sensor histidine kinase [Streptomyces]|uniref:Histidine kinase n=1 Tax=Streptomyces solicathayae TaxID=3081768 RepID=A0ABZ0LVA2_9ACTN|nr:histidine kinase [Streptomyces sp. HUAS YS2]WOX23438.1 histidine kinase [Streptomyces sp. HUAS YS2]